ncbi:MAG: efflux RND transporter periplasmic adaptor subunit [Polyangiaceae bacterium]
MKPRYVLGAVGLLLLGGAGFFVSRKHDSAAHSAAAASASAADRPIPVLIAPVAQRDMPIYLDGLGSVVSIATVTVKAQVDGRLDKVLFKEGQTVHRGDLLGQVDPRPFTIQLHTAEAAMARDSAQLRNSKLNLERFKTLRQQDLIPQQQVDDQQTLVDQGDATTRTDQAQVDTARLQLDYARIVSPIDGVTGVRLVDSGNVVHASDATGIVVITQIDPIAVMFTLPEDELPKVSKQLALGPIAIEVYGRDGTTKLSTGQLALIDNQINQATATIRLKAIFSNPDKSLWPNEFVKARLLLTTRKNSLVVPAAALQRGPQGMFVYVVGADQTVAMRAVELETTVGEEAIVARGLAAGDHVVADGQSQLRPGSKVSSHPPDKPQPAASTARGGAP